MRRLARDRACRVRTGACGERVRERYRAATRAVPADARRHSPQPRLQLSGEAPAQRDRRGGRRVGSRIPKAKAGVQSVLHAVRTRRSVPRAGAPDRMVEAPPPRLDRVPLRPQDRRVRVRRAPQRAVRHRQPASARVPARERGGPGAARRLWRHRLRQPATRQLVASLRSLHALGLVGAAVRRQPIATRATYATSSPGPRAPTPTSTATPRPLR